MNSGADAAMASEPAGSSVDTRRVARAEALVNSVSGLAAIRHINKARSSAAIESLEALCARASETMRETLDKATNLVNYGTATARHTAQDRADRFFGTGRRSA